MKYGGALVALAMCSACGGSADTPSSAARLNSLPRYATILPDRHAKSKTFEYVINAYGSYASIFDYPKSDHQVGTISNVGGQGCTNVLYGYGKKSFWIVAGDNEINEYEVPQKPIKTLSDSVGFPSSCAMDTSGDLAVGILNDYSGSGGGGDVVIFKKASGSGTVYTTPLFEELFDGYDPSGDLFADGFNSGGHFELVELPTGSGTFETITTSNTVGSPGSVQWDGKYLTVFDQGTDAIYRYTVRRTKATLEGTVRLKGGGDCSQTWIVKGYVFCADAGKDDGEVFKYPAGGSPMAIFAGDFDTPLGVVAVQK